MHNTIIIIYNTKNEILWFSISFVNSEEGDGHILLFSSQMHILSQNFQKQHLLLCIAAMSFLDEKPFFLYFLHTYIFYNSFTL